MEWSSTGDAVFTRIFLASTASLRLRSSAMDASLFHSTSAPSAVPSAMRMEHKRPGLPLRSNVFWQGISKIRTRTVASSPSFSEFSAFGSAIAATMPSVINPPYRSRISSFSAN
ncbi:Uncharacterised protein [Candidatus Norongarragalina meridionalis]|nr:Uncharacterised protein [Candidatus Norongarragalina meridionalis]